MPATLAPLPVIDPMTTCGGPNLPKRVVLGEPASYRRISAPSM